MRFILRLFPVLALLFLAQCGISSKAYVSKDFKRDKHENIIIAKTNDKGFADAMVTEFLGIGISVIDRQNMDAMLKEQELSQSGTIDPETAKRIGKVTGADAILVLEWYGGMYPLAKLRMVDAESGAILMSGIFKQTSGDAVSKTTIAEDFASRIKSQL